MTETAADNKAEQTRISLYGSRITVPAAQQQGKRVIEQRCQ
jgi:hypothetical protein